MATAGNAAKVGAAVLVALVLFGGMWAFFLQQSVLSQNYTLDVLFDDASGLDTGSIVQQAGVQVGTVDAITLQGQKANLHLKIYEKLNGKPYRIPRGSQFVASTPLLGSTGTLAIVPPSDAYLHPKDVIQPGSANLAGTRPGDLTSSLTHANALIDQLTATTKNANALLTDRRVQNGLLQTVGNLKAASQSGATLADNLNRSLAEDNAQVQLLLRQTRSGTQVALGNIADTTGQIRNLTVQNRAQLNEMIANLRDTTASIAGLTQQANDLLKNGKISQNLSASVANLKATTDKLSAVAGNIQSLTGDATVQGNLKQTVQNIRDASEQTNLLLERLNKLAGTKKKAGAVVVAPGSSSGPVIVVPGTLPTLGGKQTNKIFIPLIAPRVDFLQNTRDSHFRVDVDAVVPIGGPTPGLFGRVGIYGLGDSNSAGKLILQGGRVIGVTGLLDARAGLYQSKLSIGGDFGLGHNDTLSVELYDPNRYHLDVRGVVKFTPALGLVVGSEDLTRRSSPLIGLEYRSSGKKTNGHP